MYATGKKNALNVIPQPKPPVGALTPEVLMRVISSCDRLPKGSILGLDETRSDFMEMYQSNMVL